MKIFTNVEISTEELFRLRSECETLYDHIEELLKKSYIETPAEKASSEPSAEPKKEETFEDGFIQGLNVKPHPTKPFEIVIE